MCVVFFYKFLGRIHCWPLKNLLFHWVTILYFPVPEAQPENHLLNHNSCHILFDQWIVKTKYFFSLFSVLHPTFLLYIFSKTINHFPFFLNLSAASIMPESQECYIYSHIKSWINSQPALSVWKTAHACRTHTIVTWLATRLHLWTLVTK